MASQTASQLRLTVVRLGRPTHSPWRRFQTTWSPNAQPLSTAVAPEPPPMAAPLAKLSTSNLVRALLLHSVTASPMMLSMGTKVLMSQIESIEKNKPLKWLIDNSFYAQFCAGRTASEIAATVSHLRTLGFAGVILNYGREVTLTDTPTAHNQSAQIQQWLKGTLATISYTDPGDFVAVKPSGAGLSSLPLLYAKKKCFENPQLGDALIQICEEAKKRGVRLLMDAEQSGLQPGVDGWTLELMRRYNTEGEAVIYNTYQMYLRRAPQVLSDHVAAATRDGFRLGVKLVRGAYLATDPREDIWATKADTDAAYDNAVRFLMAGTPEHPIRSGPEAAQRNRVDLMIATHNKESVAAARALPSGVGVERLSFAQLMGMADELSLGLVAAGEQEKAGGGVKVYKYAVWGTTSECVKYLIRRAEENKDAVGRSKENRGACWDEIKRRAGMGGDVDIKEQHHDGAGHGHRMGMGSGTNGGAMHIT